MEIPVHRMPRWAVVSWMAGFAFDSDDAPRFIAYLNELLKLMPASAGNGD